MYKTSQQFGSWNYATNTLVNNNVWGPSASWSQTLNACSPSSWYVNATIPSDGGAIQSYPDSQYVVSGKTVAQYTSLASCFAEQSPTGAWDGDWGYDTWLNNFGAEVMIWNEWTQTGAYPPSSARSVTIDGVVYKEWKGGGSNEYIYVPTTQKKSGCIDVLHFFQDLVSIGVLHNTDVPNAVEYGVEIASTNSTAQRFDVTNFTFAAS